MAKDKKREVLECSSFTSFFIVLDQILDQLHIMNDCSIVSSFCTPPKTWKNKKAPGQTRTDDLRITKERNLRFLTFSNMP